MIGIFERVAVQRPYVALSDIECTDHGISARVRRYHPMKRERGQIAAAEAGRHLAIAGAMAAALKNNKEGKHFYLARRAILAQVSEAVSDDDSLAFKVNAVSNGVIKRAATSSAYLSCVGKLNNLFHLHIEFDVISPSIFQRLIKTLPKVGSTIQENLDILNNSPKVIYLDHTEIIGEHSILPAYCDGHFPDYPALPVAKIMHILSNLACDLMAFRTNDAYSTYVVKKAEVSADRLAFAGETVRFHAKHVGYEGDNMHLIQCSAVSRDGVEYGSMHLYLSQ